MNNTIRLIPDFLQTETSKLFYLKVAVDKPAKNDAAVVFIPPFAEEMNRSRKMMTMLLKRFAANADGYIFDFSGTGDSQGDFGEQSWQGWSRDLSDFVKGMVHKSQYQSLQIITLRTGSLVLSEASRLPGFETISPLVKAIHMWNPVLNPTQYFNQFLRIQLAAEMMKEDGQKRTAKDLVAELQEKGELEIAGYMINATLYQQFVSSEPALSDNLSGCALRIYDLNAQGAVTPAIQMGMKKHFPTHENMHQVGVQGDQFWSTQEISVSEALINTTAINMMER